MWRSGRRQINTEKLDRFGEELLHALEATESEVATAASSPFLYRRIRARIEAEERRRSEERSILFQMLAGIRHAIPVFAMIAILMAGIVWYVPLQNGNQSAQGVFVSADTPSISGDEMMASVIGWSDRRAAQSEESK